MTQKTQPLSMPLSIDAPTARYSSQLTESIKGIKIGIEPYFFDNVDAEVEKVLAIGKFPMVFGS